MASSTTKGTYKESQDINDPAIAMASESLFGRGNPNGPSKSGLIPLCLVPDKPEEGNIRSKYISFAGGTYAGKYEDGRGTGEEYADVNVGTFWERIKPIPQKKNPEAEPHDIPNELSSSFQAPFRASQRLSVSETRVKGWARKDSPVPHISSPNTDQTSLTLLTSAFNGQLASLARRSNPTLPLMLQRRIAGTRVPYSGRVFQSYIQSPALPSPGVHRRP